MITRVGCAPKVEIHTPLWLTMCPIPLPIILAFNAFSGRGKWGIREQFSTVTRKHRDVPPYGSKPTDRLIG